MFFIKEGRAFFDKLRMRGDVYRPSFYVVVRSLLNNCLGRALGCASAALQALIGVDLIVQFAHVDRFGRALGCASTAGQALIGNNKSHYLTSHVI